MSAEALAHLDADNFRSDRLEASRAHPVLCWFSRNGAEQGKPWCVQHTDGSRELVSAVRMTGVVDFVAAPDGLPDGPRFVARLVEGQMLAGK